MSSLAEKLSQGGRWNRPSGEATPPEKLACPLCQMNFQEFRNTGRLGCPV